MLGILRKIIPNKPIIETQTPVADGEPALEDLRQQILAANHRWVAVHHARYAAFDQWVKAKSVENCAALAQAEENVKAAGRARFEALRAWRVAFRDFSMSVKRKQGFVG